MSECKKIMPPVKAIKLFFSSSSLTVLRKKARAFVPKNFLVHLMFPSKTRVERTKTVNKKKLSGTNGLAFLAVASVTEKKLFTEEPSTIFFPSLSEQN